MKEIDEILDQLEEDYFERNEIKIMRGMSNDQMFFDEVTYMPKEESSFWENLFKKGGKQNGR